MRRKIELQFDAEQMETLVKNTSQDEVNKAIAYLSTWNMSIEHCKLQINSDCDEITALYRRNYDNNPPAYVIGAIWHGNHFGFHS